MEKDKIDHAQYLNIVKRILKASYVAWETVGDKRSLIVKVQGKRHELVLEGEEINHETYSHLINNLLGNSAEEKEDEKI
jgi:hypothetical protein